MTGGRRLRRPPVPRSTPPDRTALDTANPQTDAPPGARTDDDPVEASRMTLGEHLDELRTRLIRSAIAFGIVLSVAYAFWGTIVEVVLHPYHQAMEMLAVDWQEETLRRWQADPDAPRTKYFMSADPDDMRPLHPLRTDPRADSAGAGIFFALKCCMYFSIAVAGPYVLWQIWQFVAAGLYKKEKRAVYRTFPAAVGLFLTGVLFGYFYMVPFAYYALPAMTIEQLQFDPEISSYFLFLRSLSLGMGVVFLLPIVMLVLSRAGIVEPEKYATYRGHFLIGSLVFAAFLTPPDPFTMVMMAAPMIVLYEIGRLVALAGARKRAAAESAVEAP